MIKWKLLSTSQQPSPQMQTSSRLLLFRAIFTNFICVVIGLMIGYYLTHTWLSNKSQYSYSNLPAKITTEPDVMEEMPLSTNNKTAIPITPTATTNSREVTEDIVEYLHNTTRVLCWIMTNPDNHLTKAIHVRNTWGHRCNKLLFMSTEADEELGSIKLDVSEGREYLWDKTQSALKYIYDHHLNDAEWFLKADDDTYVIMENLRSFLYRYPPEAPVYFGCKFKRFIKQGYMSGGAGYVLSKTALVKFATEAYNNTAVCRQEYQVEDAQLGLCLENVGVIAGDSRDEERKERFVPLSPEDIIPEDKSSWYKQFAYHRPNEGYMSGGAGYVLSKTALVKFSTEAYNNTEVCHQDNQEEDIQLGLCLQNVGVIAGDSRDEERKERFVPLSPEDIIPEDTSEWFKEYVYHSPNENVTCCSPSAISFHYITADQFYIIDYLLYTLRPFGVHHKLELPPKISVSDVFSLALEYFYPLPSPPLPLSDDDIS